MKFGLVVRLYCSRWLFLVLLLSLSACGGESASNANSATDAGGNSDPVVDTNTGDNQLPEVIHSDAGAI